MLLLASQRREVKVDRISDPGERTRMRRRTWILLPFLLLLAAGTITVYLNRGVIRKRMLDFLHSFDDTHEVRADSVEANPPGRWWGARDGGVTDSLLTDEQREQVELIRSIGYLSGYEEAPVSHGVTVNVSDLTSPGYTLLISGHGPGISLIDMEGEVVHDWFTNEVTVYGLWPEAENPEVDMDLWRRAHLYTDGSLVALINDGGVVRVDRNSRLVWASEYLGAHHDLDVAPDGTIYAIGRRIHVNERYNPDEFLVEDYICVLDSSGHTMEMISMMDLVADSRFAPVLRRAMDGVGTPLLMAGDMLHCNTIEYIDDSMLPEGYEGPLRPGSLLLSMRAVDLVCAVDLAEKEIYWGESSLWHLQHQPTLLPDGHLLVFDNQGKGETSTVLEFDPGGTRDVLWSYSGDVDHPFYSVGVGSCQRLPNGNTLITESMFGRAFEVTREGDIVWEYYNPHRAGEHLELIATLHEAYRYAPEEVEAWLHR